MGKWVVVSLLVLGGALEVFATRRVTPRPLGTVDEQIVAVPLDAGTEAQCFDGPLLPQHADVRL